MSFFCSLPFDTIIVYPGNHVRPCCRFDPGREIKFDNYFTDPMMTRVKQQLLNNQVPRECKSCAEQEKASGNSLRLMNQKFSNNDINKIIEANDPTYFDVKYVEIITSNVCNLLCLPCEYGSYKRNAELRKMGLQKVIPLRFVHEENKLLYDLNVEKITFYGGEPFSDKITFQLIDGLIASGRSKNIRIDLNSNITLATEEQLLKLKNNFQRVYIKASIDGFEKTNEYLRYPATWKEIEDGLDRMIKSGVDVCVNVALSNLALLTLDKLIPWVVKEKKIIDMYFTHVEPMTVINTPMALKYTHLPAGIKRSLISKFYLMLKDPAYNERVQELIKAAIEICLTPGEDIDDLIEFLDIHDQHRGTDFRTLWPEIEHYRK